MSYLNISKGPKYRFPSNIDFPKYPIEIAMHLLKVWPKRHPGLRRKMRAGSRKFTFMVL